MAKNKVIKCPYKECAVSNNKSLVWTQFVFLVFAYCLLIKSPKDFNPSAVILYVAPPTIELAYQKTYNKLFGALKCIFITYSAFVFGICFLILNGAIEYQGESYCFLKSAVAFSSITINKKYLATSLLSVVAIPFISHFSKPERNDDHIAEKYNKKGTYV